MLAPVPAPEAPAPSRPKPDLRERALRLGATDLADVELVALLLGTGAFGLGALRIAASLLEEAGTLSGLSRITAPALAAIRGVGPAKAARLVAALELGRRSALAATEETRAVFRSFEEVAAWARPRLALLEHEEVWMLSLDGRNGLLAMRRIAQGGVHGCALLPRDVLRPAVRDGASAMVVVHNHPSGDPTPSMADVQMTRALGEAGRLVGVELLDHVVVGRDGARSLRELGALDEPEQALVQASDSRPSRAETRSRRRAATPAPER